MSCPEEVTVLPVAMVKPLPNKEMVLPLEEEMFSFRVKVPPYAVIGPAIVVDEPNVISAVLVVLPIVNPDEFVLVFH